MPLTENRTFELFSSFMLQKKGNNKCNSEDIKAQLGLSKKAFKRGLESLYKQKKVIILEDCVKLL